MRERIWSTVFCVCLLVALAPINLSQDKELKWPCKDDPNLLRNKNLTDPDEITDSVTMPRDLPCKTNARLLKDDNGKPVWIGAKEMKNRAVYKVDPYLDPHFKSGSTLFADLLVNEDGAVVCAKIPNGHPVLRDLVLSAAAKWKFQPMTEGGRKVSFLGRLLFTLTRE